MLYHLQLPIGLAKKFVWIFCTMLWKTQMKFLVNSIWCPPTILLKDNLSNNTLAFFFLSVHKLLSDVFAFLLITFPRVHAHMLSCVRLCASLDCSPSGSSVHEIFQARILKWVAISSRGSSRARDQTQASPASPALAGGFFTTEPPGKPLHCP